MAEDEVTLYGYWRSSCSWRVRIGKLRLRRFCCDARGLHRTHTPPPPPPPVPCLQPIEEKWDRSYLTACYIAHDVVQNVWPAAPSVYRDVRAAGVQRAASRCTAGIERNLNDTSSVLFFFFKTFFSISVASRLGCVVVCTTTCCTHAVSEQLRNRCWVYNPDV